MKNFLSINWDTIGISASLACAIHCAVLPLFLTSLPVFGIEIIHNVFFEYGMIVLAAIIGSTTLYHGWKKHHHNKQPLMIFIAGIALLFAKEVWHSAALLLVIPAAFLIITAHYRNYIYCKRSNHCHADDCSHDHILP